MLVNRTVKTATDADARKAGEIHTREWGFDFTGVVDEVVREIATDALVVKMQQRFRKDPSEFNPHGETFMVTDVLRRVARGPTEPLRNFLRTIGVTVDTEVEAREVMTRMAAKVKK